MSNIGDNLSFAWGRVAFNFSVVMLLVHHECIHPIPSGLRCWNCDNHRISLVPMKLTHCGLVTPYGDIDLGRHWLR